MSSPPLAVGLKDGPEAKGLADAGVVPDGVGVADAHGHDHQVIPVVTGNLCAWFKAL